MKEKFKLILIFFITIVLFFILTACNYGGEFKDKEQIPSDFIDKIQYI